MHLLRVLKPLWDVLKASGCVANSAELRRVFREARLGKESVLKCMNCT